MKNVATLFLVTMLCASAQAFAALGEQASTITKDQTKLSAERKNADVFQKYSVQELDSDANTIKEYVDNNGVIFAITWKGVDHPDLSVILGSYFDAYQKSEKETPRTHGKRSRNIQRENLVVQKWGQMRSLRGRAYDPSLIPSGVALNEIK